MKSIGAVAASGVFMLGLAVMTACSPLEPMAEPEVSDLQLTVDTLRTSLRDAQRTIAELRTEVESRRQELADIQIARAQLEGRVREAERRLVEARHIIDLQREELAGSRSERERVARTGAVLQNQLKQLQKQLSKMGKQASEAHGTGTSPASFSGPRGRQMAAAPAKAELTTSGGETAGSVANPARVSVKPGDTLWSIAQRYRVPVNRLKAINKLPDNQIQVGQALWLTARPAADEREHTE